MMARPFTPEQEARISEIVMQTVIAASRAQAQLAANHQIDLLRLRREWVEEFLSETVAEQASDNRGEN